MKLNRPIPELLAPAGSLEKLKTAVTYGADAVYLSGQSYGLRAASDNFTESELREGIPFAHDRGAKTYVVLNAFPHDKDFESLPSFLSILEELGVDAVIISDLGMIHQVRFHSNLPVHLSTQASCLNSGAGFIWKEQGVKRLILGRESSIESAAKIKKETGLEVELFIHGSMCMAYSGHCTISNYTLGRDSNRGGCGHSCRFEYQFESESNPVTFLSSKDLMGIKRIPEFFEFGIDSLKIEGRMKSPMYAAITSKIYKEAIEEYRRTGTISEPSVKDWVSQFDRLPNRGYTEASLMGPAQRDSVSKDLSEPRSKRSEYIGKILESGEDGRAWVEVRFQFKAGDQIELVSLRGKSQIFTVRKMTDALGSPIEFAKPNRVVCLHDFPPAESDLLLRELG